MFGRRKDKLLKEKKKSSGLRRRGPMKAEPINIKEIDENIQRLMRIKRAAQGEENYSVDNVQVRDTGCGTNLSGISAPYNQRLVSSTPQDTPMKTATKASVNQLLQGDVDEHAMNSYEYIQSHHAQDKGPVLKQGQTEFKQNPLQMLEPRTAFIQQHLEGMRQAYVQNIHSNVSRQPHHHGNQHDRKSGEHLGLTVGKEMYVAGLPSTVPAPIVLSAAHPTIYPQLSQPVIISTGGGDGSAYPHGVSQQALGKYQQSAPPGDSRADKEAAHFSLYTDDDASKEASKAVGESETRSNGTAKITVTTDGENAGADERKPISPFKAETGSSGVDDAVSRGQQVRREEALRSALKIALDENGFVKSGPISPFKPGTAGFSALSQGRSSRQESQGSSQQHGRSSRQEQEQGVQTSEVEDSSGDEHDSTLIEETPRDKNTKSKRVATTTGKTDSGGNHKEAVKSATGTSRKAAATVSTRNKKVQFVAGKKKTPSATKDVKVRKNGGTPGAKFTKSTPPSEKSLKQTNTTSKKSQDVSTKSKQRNEEKCEEERKEEGYEGGREAVKGGREAVKEGEELSQPVGGAVRESERNNTLQKAQYLVKELKAVPGIKVDKEGKRLMKELEETLHSGSVNWQTELDLIAQPVRSENAQLRRKLRIMTQQMKNKDSVSRDTAQSEGRRGEDRGQSEDYDSGYVVVSLQMKVYNLENQIEALTQLNAKLKAEVEVYLPELDRLRGEKNQLLELLGNQGAGVVGSESRHSKLDGATFKHMTREWEREKNDLQHRLSVKAIHYRQKEEELAHMTELVRSLEESMGRLLGDLQTSKPYPQLSVERLDRELKQVQSLMSQHKHTQDEDSGGFRPSQTDPARWETKRRSLSADRTATHSDAHHRPSQYTDNRQRTLTSGQYPLWRPRSQQPEPIGSEYGSGRQRAEKHAARIEEKPNNRELQSRSEALNKASSAADVIRYDNKAAGPGYRGNESRWQRPWSEGEREVGGHQPEKEMPVAHPGEKVGLFLMDEPGLNYRKMAEGLSDGHQRVSMSTEAGTEYLMYPGMSPIKTDTPFQKLDPFIKDLLANQKLKEAKHSANGNTDNKAEGLMNRDTGRKTDRNNPDRLKSSSEPTFGDASGHLDQVGDNKGSKEKKEWSPRFSESKDTVSSAPTVKEILTPIADKMERFKTSVAENSRAVRAINFNDPPGGKTTNHTEKRGNNKNNNSSEEESYNLDLEEALDKFHCEMSSQHDTSTSTFSSERNDQPPGENQVNYDENRTHSDSRYSVTDYFKKYPQERKPLPGRVTQQEVGEARGHDPELRLDLSPLKDSGDSDEPRLPPPGMDAEYWADKVLISPHGIPVIFDDSNSDGQSTEFNSNRAVAPGTFRSLRDLQDADSVSPQHRLYQGTDLDNSLSSINDVVSVDTATTATSVSSVDDRLFRQGLANLDANIARVQESLRQKIY